MKTKLFAALSLTFLAILHLQLATAFAQGTAFTYQGRLNDGASPANGTYDLTFVLFNAASGPAQVGSTLTNSATAVSNGLFTVVLDFGNQFPGADRWLEIGVRTNGGGAFTNLSPRQPITSTPYAVRALDAGTAASYAGAISDSQLSANIARLNSSNTFSGTVLFSNPSNTYTGTFTGNGVGVTNILLGTPGNNWPGIFVLNSSPTAGNPPRSVAALDVNSDGKLDLVCVNPGSSTVVVLTNNGGGGFVAAATNGVSVSPSYVAAADVNGDSRLDVISKSASMGGSFFTVLTNNGSGGLVAVSTNNASGGGTGFVTADFNGDGKPDLASAGGGGGLSVLTNDGSGGFVVAFAVGASFSVTAADVNGDGKMDLISGPVSGPTSLSVLTNSGNAEFATASTPTVGPNINSVTTADINGDGTPDLICVNANGTLNVFTNAGSGAFGPPSTNSVGSTPAWVTAVDLNSDGKVDVICANNTSPGKLTALTNNGSGGFVAAFTNSVGNNPFAVITADVNGDGRQDLVSAHNSGSTLSVLFNTPMPNGAYDYSSQIALNNVGNSFSGDGAGLTGLNASQLTSGTVPLARLPAAVVTNNQSGVTLTGTFAGNGSGLTNVPGPWQLNGSNTFYNAGNVGIGTNNPQTALQVNGGIRFGAGGAFYPPAALENLRLIRGVVSSAGTLLGRSGFTVTRTGLGAYTVTFDTAFAAAPTITATVQSGLSHLVTSASVVAGSAQFRTFVSSTAAAADLQFHFIAIGP